MDDFDPKANEEAVLPQVEDAVVEDCVNAVGVDVNTASPQLLGYVAGVGPSLARKIVAVRQEKGAFPNRAALRKVSGFGPKTLLRISTWVGWMHERLTNPIDWCHSLSFWSPSRSFTTK